MPTVPICWMWGCLATAAAAGDCDTMVLLGDDTAVRPAGAWPHLVTEAFRADDRLQLLLLKDEAEPGFPSFPVLRTAHLVRFDGRLLPDAFVNQDGDPFLFELYRCMPGAAASSSEVSIVNKRGGVQVTGAEYMPPLYKRCHMPYDRFKSELKAWQQRLTLGNHLALRGTTVDVLIPSYRADPAALDRLLSVRCKDAATSLRFLLRIDDPEKAPDAKLQAWLASRKSTLLHQLRVHFNEANQGAAATRNALLDESTADFAILWDDDVVPSRDCIDAYVAAFKAHPDALAWAGPTVMPHSGGIMRQGVHLSDVTHFWEAPLRDDTMPWAVTANLAVRQTPARFGAGFPHSGGGEDVDFCVRLGVPVISVPDAVVHHPWWPGGRWAVYRHLFGWAFGDGRLMDLHPVFSYRRAPCAVETSAVTAVAGVAGLWPLRSIAAAVAAVLAADLAMDIARNFLSQERWAMHPECTGLTRLGACGEAFTCKTVSEAGRLWGHVRRGRIANIGRRFDWFLGTDSAVVADEQLAAAARAGAFLLAAAAAVHYR